MQLVNLFFFNDTATTEIYTLSLHDALPISRGCSPPRSATCRGARTGCIGRSEEHTSELQSQSNLVCRLLLEKKKIKSVLLRMILDVVYFTQHATRYNRLLRWNCLVST